MICFKRWTQLFVLGAVSCTPVRSFHSSPNDGKRYNPESEKATFTVSCLMESLNKSEAYPLERKALNYRFSFEKSCPDLRRERVVQDVTKPLNMMLVIDITGSMDKSLDAVKKGVLDLARNLKSRGWDIQFAAIGFADDFREFRVADFNDPEVFQVEIGSWKTVDGKDFQEAGQHALSLALDKMVLHRKKTGSERKDAEDVLLYISDNVAYSERSEQHTDFSTQDLAEKLQRIKKEDLKTLKIYNSIPMEVPEREQVEGAPAPRAQFEELLKKAGIEGGESLKFPVDLEVLSVFQNRYQRTVSAPALPCFVESLSLQSAKNQGVASASSFSSDLRKMDLSSIAFEVSQDAKTTDYVLEIHRCCRKEEEQKQCDLPAKSQISLKFKNESY